MSKKGFEWRGDDAMLRRMDDYERRAVAVTREIATYFAPVLEAHAKANAPWTDRTANARQALRGYVGDDPPRKPSGENAAEYPRADDLARDIVAIYLSHGMNYGVYLEASMQARYAIIWPTIQEHLPHIRQMLQRVFT